MAWVSAASSAPSDAALGSALRAILSAQQSGAFKEEKSSPPASKTRSQARPEWRCGCKTSNFMSRATCRECGRAAPQYRSVSKLLASRSRAVQVAPPASSPATQKSAKSAPSPKSPTKKDVALDAAGDSLMADAEDFDPDWANMTVSELKQEVAKLENLLKSLKEACCADACQQVEERVRGLKAVLHGRMPVPQRLEQLISQVRKAQAAKAKADEALEEVLQRVCQAEERQRACASLLEEAQTALESFKDDMMTKKPSPEASPEDDQLSACLQELDQQIPANLLPLTKTLRGHISRRLRSSPSPPPVGGSRAVAAGDAAPIPPTLVDASNSPDQNAQSQSVLALPPAESEGGYEAVKASAAPPRSAPYQEGAHK